MGAKDNPGFEVEMEYSNNNKTPRQQQVAQELIYVTKKRKERKVIFHLSNKNKNRS